ncbi:MAG: tyrosine--tRNA ligase [Candidatus Omnitrophica bacterium]|nr:tyrosine--tRNA ligase [Candidatus Omnitrophota bacterium]
MEVAKQLELIKRGTVDIISEEELVKKLNRSKQTGKPLRIKAGFDPTAPDIHLGHTVLLRKLRQFQECGHLVFFLIGDFTARIGDPTGKSQLRKTLSRAEISRNARTYKKQAGKILDMRRTRIVFNSAWLERMRLSGILGICMHVTVSQMLTREDFRKRLDNKQDVSMLEFMYPILQGYDSVFLKSDVEIGGTDQLFNLLVGRDLQRDFDQEPQVVLTLPLLEGTDGVNKMSKSLGNYIGINDKAPDMFGKTMSISDELMCKYFTLLTDENLENIKKMHPREAKLLLAERICRQYHCAETAKAAREEFIRVFSSKEIPRDVPRAKLNAPKALIEIMAENKITPSKNEARRLIRQGAVDFECDKITDENFIIDRSGLLKAGSRRFLKIEIQGK